MRKLLCIFLAITIVCTILPLVPVTATTPIFGDGDGNGNANATDALICLKITVGKIAATEEQKFNLDVDANKTINANDALEILKFTVGKITRFSGFPGTYLVQDDSQWLDMSMDEIIDTIDHETPATPISDSYKLHADGGLIYNPLSRELDQGDKTKYNIAPKTNGKLTLSNGAVMNYSVPTDVTAYDMIPIEYTLTNPKEQSETLHISATTFEDKDGSFYDLNLPHEVAIKAEYQGYVAATTNGANRPWLSPYQNKNVVGQQYPQYDTENLVASDTVKQSNYIWFKFKITNVGDTILDGDGNGTFCFDPVLLRHNQDGTTETIDNDNLFSRITEDLYPGESTELYFYFRYPSAPNNLAAGNYTIQLTHVVRNEKERPDWSTKIWGGYTYGESTHNITIGDTAGTNIANETKNKTFHTGTRNGWMHSYEEFTSSFDSWLEPWVIKSTEKNTMWVQPAAWSDRLVLKFMSGDNGDMVSATIPLTVETNSIQVKLNTTAENYIITQEGTKYPASASQSMCDMRVNISQHPDAAAKQLDELLDMKECGINIVTTTMAFNLAGGGHHNPNPSDMQDSNYFMSDMTKKLGMRLEGYMSYPYASDDGWSARWYTGDNQYKVKPYDFGDLMTGQTEGLRGLYQFMQWGHNYYINGAGKPVIVTEDTRGWMRIDFRARFRMGENATSLANFRKWVMKKYGGSFEALNHSWGTAYSSVKEIDPEYGTTDDHGWCNYTQGYSDFYEWSNAMNDFDIYRTLERTYGYQEAINIMKNYTQDNPDFPAASIDTTIGIRTEGGNMTGVVPYDTNISHFRHTYYSQRRNALIPQILAKSGTVSLHSDYVTLPYSVSELEKLVSSSTSLGITSMPLFQSNRMRDIAINPQYADAVYDIEYNMEDCNVCGAYINTQLSVFEMFKAVYENGGIPGVLWEDYLCDGYVTETQQKDM
ncbi:MAG: hypothetical protein IKU10_01980, partial [Clostridia bacterium]|nr:hypothetical protein [Clostridia bacterium]